MGPVEAAHISPAPWKTQGRQSWKQTARAGTCPSAGRKTCRTLLQCMHSKASALGQIRDLFAGCLLGQGWGEVSKADCRRCLERVMHASDHLCEGRESDM